MFKIALLAVTLTACGGSPVAVSHPVEDPDAAPDAGGHPDAAPPMADAAPYAGPLCCWDGTTGSQVTCAQGFVCGAISCSQGCALGARCSSSAFAPDDIGIVTVPCGTPVDGGAADAAE